jgi:hypothetical protein
MTARLIAGTLAAASLALLTGGTAAWAAPATTAATTAPVIVGATGAGHYFWETAPGVYTADKTGTLAAAGDPWFVSVVTTRGGVAPIVAADKGTGYAFLIPEADATSRQLSLANANQ